MKSKILHIVYSGVGGGGSVATSIITGDKKNEFKHELLFTGREKIFNAYERLCKEKNITYYKSDKIKNFLIRDYKIFKIIKKVNPKVIIFHVDNYLTTILLNFYYKFNLIYVDHWPMAYRTMKNYIFNYFIFIFFDKIIYLYSDYKNQILQKQKILKYFNKKISIISNGVQINNNVVKNKAQIFRLGMISRYSFGKKQILLVESILKIKKTNPNLKIRLELIGNGENFLTVKKKIQQNKLKDVIFLRKSLPEYELKKWFSNIDLYCHISKEEGLSTAILHALSNKTLVLVSKNDGNKFLKKYVFFTKNKSSDVSKKIMYIQNNKSLFNKKIDIAFKLLKKKYSNEVMFKSYKKELIKFCEKKN